MREIHCPALVERPDINSTITLIHERANAAPSHIAFRTKDGKQTRDYTLPQFLELVDGVARGLIDRGFEHGDRAAIMASTSFEWAVAEFAIWRAGGVVVPIYETTPVPRALEIATDASVRVIFVDDGVPSEIDQASTDFGTWQLKGTSRQSLSHFSRPASEDLDAELESRRQATERTDVASIVYTSGTTGEQKGARITHANFVDLVLNVQAAWKDVLNEDGRTVIFLPLAHVLARGLQMICMWAGMRVTHMSEPTELIAALPELKPTFLVVVPRVMEKILGAVAGKARKKGLGKVWRAAEQTAIAWGKACEVADRRSNESSRAAANNTSVTGIISTSPQPANHSLTNASRSLANIPRSLRIRHAVFDKLFYARIRKLLGGDIEFLLSGAAALNPDTSLAFRGMGIPIMEGYGLTETTAPMAGNRPGNIRSGTVGQPVPGTTVRIADDGRILVKGIGVMDGYVKQEHTEAAFVDGFFDTGDLGLLDDDGFLTINGRLKDVLVTAGGKTVSPARWEAQLENDPLIAHAVMVGENKPYLGALIILDKTELQAWVEEHGDLMAQLVGDGPVEVDHPAVVDHVKKLVASANETVARSETVKAIRTVIVDVTAESGLLTPTLKIKRNEAITRLQQFVDDLYERTKR